MLGYLSADITCSEERTVFSERSSRKTWALTNRCPRTNIRAYFRAKWRLLCLLSFKYCSPRAQFWKLGNITQIFPSVSWDIISHVALRPMAHERRYLVDYNDSYWYFLWFDSFVHFFYCAWHLLHISDSSFDWFTGLSVLYGICVRDFFSLVLRLSMTNFSLLLFLTGCRPAHHSSKRAHKEWKISWYAVVVALLRVFYTIEFQPQVCCSPKILLWIFFHSGYSNQYMQTGFQWSFTCSLSEYW